jgi:hypothetical protein
MAKCTDEDFCNVPACEKCTRDTDWEMTSSDAEDDEDIPHPAMIDVPVNVPVMSIAEATILSKDFIDGYVYDPYTDKPRFDCKIKM